MMTDWAPIGFAKIEGATEVFIGNGEIVVVGDPPRYENEADDPHNCDAMGCRWNHVLYRAKVAT